MSDNGSVAQNYMCEQNFKQSFEAPLGTTKLWNDRKIFTILQPHYAFYLRLALSHDLSASSQSDASVFCSHSINSDITTHVHAVLCVLKEEVVTYRLLILFQRSCFLAEYPEKKHPKKLRGTLYSLYLSNVIIDRIRFSRTNLFQSWLELTQVIAVRKHSLFVLCKKGPTLKELLFTVKFWIFQKQAPKLISFPRFKVFRQYCLHSHSIHVLCRLAAIN